MRPNLELKSFRENPVHTIPDIFETTRKQWIHSLIHVLFELKICGFKISRFVWTGIDHQSRRSAATPTNAFNGDVFDLSATARISESFKRVLELFFDVSWVNEFQLYRQCYAFHHKWSVATLSCFNGAIKSWSADFVEGQAEATTKGKAIYNRQYLSSLTQLLPQS